MFNPLFWDGAKAIITAESSQTQVKLCANEIKNDSREEVQALANAVGADGSANRVGEGWGGDVSLEGLWRGSHGNG